MSDDRIEVRGLRLSARCGVLPFERSQAQPLEIDIDLIGDFSAAGRSDDLADTVDYGAVCALVEAECAASAPRLLEHLAESLVSALFASDAVRAVPVRAIELAVRKLRPPVAQQLATSGVRIVRSAVPTRGDG